MNGEQAGAAHVFIKANPEIASTITSVLPDGVLVQRIDGDVLWFNEMACTLLGLSPEQLRGERAPDPNWALLTPDGSPLDGEDRPEMRALRGAESVVGAVVGVRDGGGSVRWISTTSTRTYLKGEPIAISVFSDITEERRAAREVGRLITGLRRSLAPTSFAPADRLSVHAIYRPMTGADGVGGDFLGFERLDEHRHVFFVGDVCGHGLGAANLGIACRHTIMAAARMNAGPAGVLAVVHDTITRLDPSTYVTAVVGVIDTAPTPTRLAFAVAGHPLPFRRRRDGVIEQLGVPGRLLGMLPPAPRTTTEIDLVPGDLLVIYTDGLTDAPRPRLDGARLAELISPARDAAALSAAVAAVLPAIGEPAADDSAALIIEATV